MSGLHYGSPTTAQQLDFEQERLEDIKRKLFDIEQTVSSEPYFTVLKACYRTAGNEYQQPHINHDAYKKWLTWAKVRLSEFVTWLVKYNGDDPAEHPNLTLWHALALARSTEPIHDLPNGIQDRDSPSIQWEWLKDKPTWRNDIIYALQMATIEVQEFDSNKKRVFTLETHMKMVKYVEQYFRLMWEMQRCQEQLKNLQSEEPALQRSFNELHLRRAETGSGRGAGGAASGSGGKVPVEKSQREELQRSLNELHAKRAEAGSVRGTSGAGIVSGGQGQVEKAQRDELQRSFDELHMRRAEAGSGRGAGGSASGSGGRGRGGGRGRSGVRGRGDGRGRGGGRGRGDGAGRGEGDSGRGRGPFYEVEG